MVVQELKASTADALRRVDELMGLSQSMLSVVKDSPTKSSVKQKLHHLQSSLQHIDSELGVSALVIEVIVSLIEVTSEVYENIDIAKF